MRKTRLFISANPLNIGMEVTIFDNDFNYLAKVLRKKIGDEINVFNGSDGEFLGVISEIDKKSLQISVREKISELQKLAKVTLAFAPVKNVRIDFVATKATEMSTTKFAPIITQRSIVDKLNIERFTANVKEALEQCERNDFPEILAPQKLEKFLQTQNDNILILCDESGQGAKAHKILPEIFATKKSHQEMVILIGPEGGFSNEEFTKMRALKNLHAISLGKQILRSDTAIIAALALVQEFL